MVEASGTAAGSGGLVGEAIGAITRHIRENDLTPGDRCRARRRCRAS